MKKNRQPFNAEVNTLLIILSFVAIVGAGLLGLALLVLFFNERKCYRISMFKRAIAKFHVQVDDHENNFLDENHHRLVLTQGDFYFNETAKDALFGV